MINRVKKGVLLVNLGTPDTPKPFDVFRYLNEFLTDGRVIDSHWIKRQLLVRGVIVPKRFRQSAKAYQTIWTEEGSPLMVYGKKTKTGLQKLLGDYYVVELAMRYQNPSIEKGLKTLLEKDVEHLIIVPLFPHYASATTGSVHQRVMECISKIKIIPRMTFIQNFATHPGFINAFATIGQGYSLESYDHFLFSFHGLPQRQAVHPSCYVEQCNATAQAIIRALKLPENKISVCYQSRLGKEPWIEPYTSEIIHKLARLGKKNVLVFCPSFVCDCLETLYEISYEYAAEFKLAGGEKLDLVQGLNDHPKWFEALKHIIISN